MIDKKERLKRSSNVSTTPSTDSSKSSKTFEFFDYDEETKEKVFLDETAHLLLTSPNILGFGGGDQRGGFLSRIRQDFED